MSSPNPYSSPESDAPGPGQVPHPSRWGRASANIGLGSLLIYVVALVAMLVGTSLMAMVAIVAILALLNLCGIGMAIKALSEHNHRRGHAVAGILVNGMSLVGICLLVWQPALRSL